MCLQCKSFENTAKKEGIARENAVEDQTAQNMQSGLLSTLPVLKHHSSVGSVAYLRIGGHWFDPRLGQFSFRGFFLSHCDRILSSLTAVRCYYNGYMGKQPVAWKEYFAEYCLEELQESIIGALAAAI